MKYLKISNNKDCDLQYDSQDEASKYIDQKIPMVEFPIFRVKKKINKYVNQETIKF